MNVLNQVTLQQLKGRYFFIIFIPITEEIFESNQPKNVSQNNENLFIRFIMIVNVDGEKYEGSGASKKMAKHACARAALTKLYNMSFTPHMPGKL